MQGSLLLHFDLHTPWGLNSFLECVFFAGQPINCRNKADNPWKTWKSADGRSVGQFQLDWNTDLAQLLLLLCLPTSGTWVWGQTQFLHPADGTSFDLLLIFHFFPHNSHTENFPRRSISFRKQSTCLKTFFSQNNNCVQICTVLIGLYNYRL